MDELPQILQLSPFPASHEVLTQVQKETYLHQESRLQLLERTSPWRGVVGLVPIITDRVDAAVMDLLPDLRVIANYGAGVDNIDVNEATRRRIQVTNTPGVLSESVADLTWGLLLAACRRIVESDETMRTGQFHGWEPSYQLGIDVYGKTLGIVGLGQIGEAVAQRAKGFNMKVLYTRRNRLHPEMEEALEVSYRSFDELLAECDFLSLHMPLTPETRHLMNRQTLAKMRPGSVLINTSRGPLVDEEALVEALKNGPLAAAGLDVFEAEPRVHPGLVALKNVLLTAHIGSATDATRKRMGDLALQNLLAFLAGEAPLNPINQT